MRSKRGWQWALILAVFFLTVYNVLPTLFYYMQPLKKPIEQREAFSIAKKGMRRVNGLEKEAVSWLKSFNALLKTKVNSVARDRENPQLIELSFPDPSHAQRFRKALPRAGSLIPFVPSQLTLTPEEIQRTSKIVSVYRHIPIHFDEKHPERYFSFTEKKEGTGKPAPLYRKIIYDRTVQLALSIGGVHENAHIVNALLQDARSFRDRERFLDLSSRLLNYVDLFGQDSAMARRYFMTFTQGCYCDRSEAIQQLIARSETWCDQLALERVSLEKEAQKKEKEEEVFDREEEQKLVSVRQQEEQMKRFLSTLRSFSSFFAKGGTPWTYQSVLEGIVSPSPLVERLDMNSLHPFIRSLEIDWERETIVLIPYPDLIALKQSLQQEGQRKKNEQIDQQIYGEIGRIGRSSGEKIVPAGQNFHIALNDLPHGKSLLAIDLQAIAKAQVDHLVQLLQREWNPSCRDFQRDYFPIWDCEEEPNSSDKKKRLGLMIYAPTRLNEAPLSGFRPSSIYVVAKGVDRIYKKFQGSPPSPQREIFMKDFESLFSLLKSYGFVGYSGSSFSLHPQFAHDFVFELEHFASLLLKATREDFKMRGTCKFATLEFSDFEQKLLAINRLETEEHEDLLKWRDDYQSACSKLDAAAQCEVPAPTKSPILHNLALSWRKFFRGDERKILRWGLDLSGGKTVQIRLHGSGGRAVTGEEEIKQGINELYRRVNKMGVSEVTIRQEGSTITLDFPSAQNVSATELIQASLMRFHVVNEKFSPYHKELASAVNEFLQNVWNEAVVTNSKEPSDINAIARRHLYGDSQEVDEVQPLGEAARKLYDHGLRLASELTPASSEFNDSLSKIVVMQGDRFVDWNEQSHPLLIVMHHHALQGTDLTNIHAGYDSSRGNFLSFEVKSSRSSPEGDRVYSRRDLYNWTSTFSQERIAGTSLGGYSSQRGWRMAVVLNDRVIQAPAIESPLRDRVSITGSFSQREINRLEADLKAGSLSFTPTILSEKNVSPELGKRDRIMGFVATGVALVLVIVLMVGYYRFAGAIASLALLFNLCIIWAALQNVQATMTLSSIAGVILTLGMAVDANVLVFERVREELALSKRLSPALYQGYFKAFSAILDSNVTTIIAALILLHFDSGPIKGFAVTLIIGILSSMFTALFVTRCFFLHWAQHAKGQVLKMAQFVKGTKIDFLKYGRWSFVVVGCVVVAGAIVFIAQRGEMIGLDFTGGYSLSLELPVREGANYREVMEEALVAQGLSKREFQVRELSPSNCVKILLGRRVDGKGYPFYQMPLHTENREATYPYQNNPRVAWIVHALQAKQIMLSPQVLNHLDQHWTSVGGQISGSMRRSASIGLLLALVCILCYITLRFEFKYAVSATIGLGIDVLATLSLTCLSHMVGVPVQIDLHTVVALMTIIGYSLNDTIIIFDRIREDVKAKKKKAFREIVNQGLNLTLSRTLMTSATTLVVLLALLTLGGEAIFSLSFVMVIGVCFGTFSSLFLAAPLLLFFHQRKRVSKKCIAS